MSAGETESIVRQTLAPLIDAGVFDTLDVEVAVALLRMAEIPGDGLKDAVPLALATALACRAPRHGHICCSLSGAAAEIRWEGTHAAAALVFPPAEAWCAALAASPLTAPGGPLVLRGDRVYLARYADLESRLAQGIEARLATSGVDEAHVDRTALARRLGVLWPTADAYREGQSRAAETAVLHRFAVIVGGPGTGKTTTVVRILALLLADRPDLRIALLAPTGKAAARLLESVNGARANPAFRVPQALRDRIPDTASTVHRALGVRLDAPGLPRHNAQNPLPYDAVVVDEASMVPLALMTRLLDAIRPDARAILLGDRHQLASVEAGAVLADLCGTPEERAASSRPLAAAVAELTASARFGPDSGVGRLARAVNEGNVPRALEILTGGRHHDVELFEGQTAAPILAALKPRCVTGLSRVARARTPGEALDALGDFRVLCAHRKGPLGVEGLNRSIETWLTEARLIRPRGDIWHGLPFLVTENDNELGVFNGDTGIFFEPPGSDGRTLFAYLPDPTPGADGPRRIPLSRLPRWEPVFAMTIHKSQGSEFGHVAVVLPEHISPVVTRELVYTGLTRARHRVTLAGNRAVLAEGIRQRVVRASGLHGRLWHSTPEFP